MKKENIDMRPITLLSALLLAGCFTEPEPRRRVIHCGTIDLTDNWEMRDTLVVKDGKCQ